MSLQLGLGTKPEHLLCRSVWHEDATLVGDYKITHDDFCAMVYYFMTNTDLSPNDPRPALLENLKRLERIDGWNKNGERLSSKSVPNEEAEPNH